MAGMCDKLTHDYISVDLVRIYETVRSDLPVLRAAIVRVLDDLAAPDDNSVP